MAQRVVWLVMSGSYDDYAVDFVCDSRGAAIRLVKERYPAPEGFTWEESYDEDGSKNLSLYRKGKIKEMAHVGTFWPYHVLVGSPVSAMIEREVSDSWDLREHEVLE